MFVGFKAAEKGFFRVLGNRLRADEESRCLTSGQCVKMVKEGHAVYPAVLYTEYEKVVKCI